MILELQDEVDFLDNNPEMLEHVKNVILECLKMEGVTTDMEVSLSIVSEDEIREINTQYREIDKITDVLSFPQVDFADENWTDAPWNKNMDTGNIILGDIILCADVAKTQAGQYGHSLLREVCFLVAHSMLHLLGYDHMTPEEEKIMLEKQDEILNNLSITRSEKL